MCSSYMCIDVHAIATLVFEDIMYLNGVSVPQAKQTMQVFDPCGPAGDLELDLSEELEVRRAMPLVSCNACVYAVWIYTALGVQHIVAAC